MNETDIIQKIDMPNTDLISKISNLNMSGIDSFEWIAMGIKIALVIFVLLNVVPLMVWVERRGSALMQNRLGPNRVGPWGIFQSIADVIKFVAKEDFIPGHVVEKFYFILAPALVLIPPFMTFAVVPFGGDITIHDHLVHLQIADLNVGLLYILSIASLGVYGIIMAGWSSNNKYSLLGSLRSCSQMISYELSLGLSILGMVMVAGSLNLREIVATQAQAMPLIPWLPQWGVFVQPLGCLIFLISMFAETNRLPFDLPEGESELVAGYHTEYGSMKFALFFMAEYMNMITASALIVTLFFGGYLLLPGMHLLTAPLSSALTFLVELTPFTIANPMDWARVILEMISFALKVSFFMWFFVWVRWTLPRFRYDQLMRLGWKVLLPFSLANIVITAMLIYLKVI